MSASETNQRGHTRRFLSAALLPALLLFGSSTASAITPPLSGTLNSADPSPLVNDGSAYYQFTTGTQGIWYSKSTDLSAWTAGGYVSPTGTPNVYPSWITTAVPGWTPGNFWAPHVAKIGGNYWMYYTCSTFGSSRSAIGLTKATSLTGMDWVDQGPVVTSDGSFDAFNAIDPYLFEDTNGTMWLSYGSFFGGIAVIQIDPATMKVKSGSTPIRIAGGNPVGADWEGSCITRNNGYYYLWANRGSCCQGLNSTYTIVVGRATAVTGPYFNQSGTALTAANANGTFVVGNVGNKLSPGGVGAFAVSGSNYMNYFYYDANNGGNTYLDIAKITYGGDWPAWSTNFSIPASSELTTSPASMAFTTAASSQNVTVTSNVAWTASTDQPAWLSASPASGSNNGAVTVNATANGGANARTGTVTISGGGISSTVSVSQNGTGYTLSATPTSVTLASSASNSVETVTSNTAWTVTSGQTWLTSSPASGSNNGSFTLSATANTTTAARVATVTLSGGGMTQLITVTQGAAGGVPIAAGTYRLVNRVSGKALDNLGSTGGGATVAQYTVGPSNNQLWVLSYVGANAKLACVTGGNYLDSLGNTWDGAQVAQWSNSGSANQQWTLTSQGGGWYQVINAGNGKALDTGGNNGNSAVMQLWFTNSSQNQQWQFVPADVPIAAGTYRLVNRVSGKALDNLGSTGSGATVAQYTVGPSNNQLWVLSYVGANAKLACVTGGNYLDSLGHTWDGAQVAQWSNSGSANQQWTLTSQGGGWYQVINVGNGKALDTGGNNGNSAVMQLWFTNSSQNQQWQFSPP